MAIRVLLPQPILPAGYEYLREHGYEVVDGRGFTEEDARTIARLITKIIDEREAAFETVRAEVKKLCDKHPLYKDDIL